MGIEFDLSGLHDDHTIRAGIPPPLSELCVRVLAANFAHRPTLRGIAPRYINRMTELLPTDLPLEVTGPLIDDEGFWKRCATQRWDNCEISAHGSSWKRCYFERNLADFLETFDPRTGQETEELTRTLAVSKDYIFSLRMKQVWGERFGKRTQRSSPPQHCSERSGRALRPARQLRLGLVPHAMAVSRRRQSSGLWSSAHARALPSHRSRPVSCAVSSAGGARACSSCAIWTWRCSFRTCPRCATSR